MHALRKLSPRPTLLLDGGPKPSAVVDPQTDTVGRPGPFGRSRVVKALPTAPAQLVAPLVVHDDGMGYLADPNGNLIGVPGLWLHRLLSARWTEDTRRLGG